MTQKLDNDFLNRFILKFPNRNGIILRLKRNVIQKKPITLNNSVLCRLAFKPNLPYLSSLHDISLHQMSRAH